MESAVVKPTAAWPPPLVVATLVSSSSRVRAPFPAPTTVSSLFCGGGGTEVQRREKPSVPKGEIAIGAVPPTENVRLAQHTTGATHLEKAAKISSAALVKYPVSAFAGIPNIPGVSSGKDFSICMLYR